MYSDDVSVISSSTNKIVKTLTVGAIPSDLDYNPSNKYIYVANTGSDDVSVISSSTIIIGVAANAGSNLRVDSCALVRLDGSSSSDNSNSSESMPRYQWTQTEGPRVLEMIRHFQIRHFQIRHLQPLRQVNKWILPLA